MRDALAVITLTLEQADASSALAVLAGVALVNVVLVAALFLLVRAGVRTSS